MNGKVVIVTGATNGIGKISALELAHMGAEVVLVSRSQSKLDSTAQEIKSATGNQKISTIQADLSSIADIRNAAETFLSRYERLDVLLNNAGAMFTSYHQSADGYEMTFALNHLSYFLLSNLLFDTLKKTAKEQGEARIVNVSSNAHFGGKVDFDNLWNREAFSITTTYGNTKLMNILFTYELARRLEGTGVTANTLHPGLVNTGFAQNDNKLVALLAKPFIALMGRSPQEGAETSIYLASSPEVTGITGKYWVDKRQKSSNKASYDQVTQKRLWEVSEELCGLKQTASV